MRAASYPNLLIPVATVGGYMTYRKSAVEKAGFKEFPTDFPGFLAMCKALKANNTPAGPAAAGHGRHPDLGDDRHAKGRGPPDAQLAGPDRLADRCTFFFRVLRSTKKNTQHAQLIFAKDHFGLIQTTVVVTDRHAFLCLYRQRTEQQKENKPPLHG